MLLSNKPIGTIAYLGGLASVLEQFCWSMIQMVQYNTEYLCQPGQYVHYFRSNASFHAFARNNIADNIKGDWLLTLDADHSFEPDLACRMLNLADQYDIDVLTAIYVHKNPPYSPVLYQMTENDTFNPIADWDKNVRAFGVDSAGAGTLFVRKKVFERIRSELKESPFDIEHPFGEDHSFFRRLKKLGIPVYAAAQINSNHLSIKPVDQSDFQLDTDLLGDRKDVGGFI